jgi:hypothetical protein
MVRDTTGKQPQVPQMPITPQRQVRPLTADEAKKELEGAIQDTDEVLATISTPLQLFPAVATLNRTKLSIVKKRPFSETSLLSLPIENLLNVTAEVGLVFGVLKIEKRFLNEMGAIRFGLFWRKDALRFATIAQGYVIALQRQIDMSSLSAFELEKTLKEIGKDKEIGYDGI